MVCRNIRPARRRYMPCSLFLVILLFTLIIPPAEPATTDYITADAPAAVVNGTLLVSLNGTFDLGIYSPTPNSDRHYLVIRRAKAIVWVANREKPLPRAASEAGILKINATTGTLLLVDGKAGTILWSSGKPSTAPGPDLMAVLYNSGNLALTSTRVTMWQSIDHPTDTLLPGMKIGYDNRTGDRWFLRSWKAVDDPTPGDYTLSLDPGPLPQLYIRVLGGTPANYLGFWNEGSFSGDMAIFDNDHVRPVFKYMSNETGAYFTYWNGNDDVEQYRMRIVLTSSGVINGFYIQEGGSWKPSSLNSRPYNCYGACGSNGVCVEGRAEHCNCLEGFDDAPRGRSCVRTPAPALSCGNVTLEFLRMEDVQLPELSNAVVMLGLNYDKCNRICSANCSCVAYSTVNISDYSNKNQTKTRLMGCIFWSGDLLGVRQPSTLGGQSLYIRPVSDPKKSSSILLRTILPSLVVATLVTLIALFIFKRRRNVARSGDEASFDISIWRDDVPLFDFSAVALATEGFSSTNKIGRGGFGVVYKGTLDGQEVAVKRLVLKPGRCLDGFMNEVKSITRLQHKNLVRLIGCCIGKGERILIYEYMKNRSLDTILFARQNQSLLDWQKRVDIIQGVARGLLYLHEESRLKVVHRDLKAANVLLDGSMNPKISDFGTARIFETDQDQVNTARVIGTLGYMSPEYAALGIFSAKSDVFSFGVLLLEIISGVRNVKGKSIYADDDEAEAKYLLQMAWTLWQQGKSLDLLEPTLVGTCPLTQVLRHIHIALLCVQENPDDRPSMSSVVLMLGSDDYQLAKPRRPGNFIETGDGSSKSNSYSGQRRDTSAAMTMTDIVGR